MKTQIKQSFYHLFVDGKANPVELRQIFLTIFLPAITGLIIYLTIHHFSH